MTKLGDLKIGMRLFLGFGVLLGIFGLAVLLTNIAIMRMERNSRELADARLPHALVAENMAFAVSQAQQFLTDVAVTHDQKALKDAEAAAEQFRVGAKMFRDLFTRQNNAKGLKEIEALETLFATFYELGKRMAAAYIVNGTAAGNKIMVSVDASASMLVDKVAAFRLQQVAEAQLLSQKNVEAVKGVQYTLFGLGAVSVIIGILISGLITRSITMPVLKGVKVATEMAAGNLEVSIAAWARMRWVSS